MNNIEINGAITDELELICDLLPSGPKGDKGDTGADGFSPTASVSKEDHIATITITDKNGTTTATISDGETGATGSAGPEGPAGRDGTNGEDGFSPIANVVKVGSTATITITDKTGTTTASITDGTNGQNGYTPVRGTDYWTAEDIATIDAYIDSKTTGLLTSNY